MKKITLIALSFAFLIAPIASNIASASNDVELYNHKDGENTITSNVVQIEPQTRYSFTDQYKSTGTSEIDITYTLSDSSTFTVRVEQFPSSKKWQVARIDFATPPNASSMVITHTIRESGHLLAKNFSLTMGN